MGQRAERLGRGKRDDRLPKAGKLRWDEGRMKVKEDRRQMTDDGN
jgi:hypothetical protein